MVEYNMLLRGKRGQVAIFVLVAILLLAMILIFYFFFADTKLGSLTGIGGGTIVPNSFLKSCIGDDLEDDVDVLSNQGGYFNPKGSIYYKGSNVKYLCYTSENYVTCTIQQPFIKNHFEKELGDSLRPKLTECVSLLKEEYESEGYTVSMKENNISLKVNPEGVDVEFNVPMTVVKDGQTETYDGFKVNYPSKLYELLYTAETLVEYEAIYGDSETTSFMQYYPDLIIEKDRLSDGTNIYIVRDVTTDERFTFASRSLVWPPGFG